MSSSSNTIAKVEQAAPNQVPLLTARTVSPTTLAEWDNGCYQYFVHCDLAEDKQVKYVTGGGLLDPLTAAWFHANRVKYNAMMFEEFMKELCSEVLDMRWEDMTHVELLSMRQRDCTFAEWSTLLRMKNNLLAVLDTGPHVLTDSLQTPRSPHILLRVLTYSSESSHTPQSPHILLTDSSQIAYQYSELSGKSLS
jgi:hypothetical protein